MRRPIEPGIRIGDPGEDDSEEARLRAALKEVASHWASGVAVVAVRDGSAFEAITVSSFLTVSLDPPIILVSIDRQAAIVPLLDAAARFTVSVLAATQQRAASLIADRVPTMRTLFSADADPVLAGAVHALVCRTEDVHPAGDHRLYVARVEQVLPGAEVAPLLYYRRRWRRLEGE
jgi:flavin reductase (DIM6/NTAB) family NADH-FMN oxidoreductase RutF